MVIATGVVVGLGLLVFTAADGPSYWTDAPEACINCHVMQPRYAAWQKGRHATVAVCNDCHTEAGSVGKLLTKGRSGVAHAFAFATGRFSEPIRIRPRSLRVARTNCGRCHVEKAESRGHGGVGPEQRDCLACHPGVGHADREE